MPERLRVVSLFSGIEGFGMGFERAGCEVVLQCEIDPDCTKVLEHRWPDVPRIKDVRDVDERTAPACDVVVGGFPCQDVSVAGRRAGLGGERSSLFWEFARVVARLVPRWVVVENVPGLLSSCGCPECRPAGDAGPVDGGAAGQGFWEDEDEAAAAARPDHRGRDMAAVLGALGHLGYGLAYRVLDAQYLGLAQRRRRLLVVGRLGDAAGAAKVLLEPEGMPGHPPPRRAKGPGAAADPEGRLGGGGAVAFDWAAGDEGGDGRGWIVKQGDYAGALGATKVQAVAYGFSHTQGLDEQATEEGTPTLRAGGSGMAVAHREVGNALTAGGVGTCGADDNQAQSGHLVSETVGTLTAGSPECGGRIGVDEAAAGHLIPEQAGPVTSSPVGWDEGIGYSTKLANTNAQGAGKVYEGYSPSVQASGPPLAVFVQEVALSVTAAADRQEPTSDTYVVEGDSDEPIPFDTTQVTSKGNYSSPRPGAPCHPLAAGGHPPAVADRARLVVRKLTPTECERLQGFPDGHTAVPGVSKSARYRMLGNAVPVPMAEWAARRLVAVERGGL